MLFSSHCLDNFLVREAGLWQSVRCLTIFLCTAPFVASALLMPINHLNWGTSSLMEERKNKAAAESIFFNTFWDTVNFYFGSSADNCSRHLNIMFMHMYICTYCQQRGFKSCCDSVMSMFAVVISSSKSKSSIP